LDECRQLTDKELHLIDAGLDHVCGAVGHVLAPGWPVTEDLARWLEGERAVYELVSFGEGILGAAEERAHLVRNGWREVTGEPACFGDLLADRLVRE